MRRCLILYGLTCIIGQVLSVRELAIAFHGNELVYGAILAIWLLLFAVGSGILGRLAGKYSLGVPSLVLALAGGGVLVPATVFAARTVPVLLSGGSGIAPSLGGVLLATFIVLAPLCLVLGFLYALTCSMVSRLEESPASAATRVYLGEAVGAFVGGVLLTYILVFVLKAFQTALMIAAVDCLAAFAVWWHGARAGRRWGWALLLCCAACSVTAFSELGKVVDFLSLTARFPGRLLQSSEDTPYGRVDVAKNRGQMEFYQSGSLVGTTHTDRSAEEIAFLAVLSHPTPYRVLIIGGAVSGVLSKALEIPWLQVDDVELDPGLVEAARQRGDAGELAALNSPRVKVFTDTDGRFFVKRTLARYDVILSAVPNPATGLMNRFYTAEFFAEARRALKKGGVLALRLDGAPTYMSAPHRALAAGVYATLQSVFGSVAAFPTDNGICYLASGARTGTFPDVASWAGRMQQWGMHPVWLTGGALADLTDPARVGALRIAFKRVNPLSLNTDMRPAAYYQELLLWADAFQVRGMKLLNWALRLDLWAVLIFVAVVTGLLALAATFAPRPLWVSLPATRMYVGMSGIVLEMVLVFAFQSIYGYVYGQLGILFAAFMVGATFGAFWAARHLSPQTDLGMLMVCQTALAVLAAAFVPILYGLARAGPGMAQGGALVVIPFLNFCVGTLVGAQYPASVSLGTAVSRNSSRPGAAAAGLYALELAGACAGALLGGAVLIPVLGIPGACWTVCSLSLASLPLLALAERRLQRGGAAGD